MKRKVDATQLDLLVKVQTDCLLMLLFISLTIVADSCDFIANR